MSMFLRIKWRQRVYLCRVSLSSWLRGLRERRAAACSISTTRKLFTTPSGPMISTLHAGQEWRFFFFLYTVYEGHEQICGFNFSTELFSFTKKSSEGFIFFNHRGAVTPGWQVLCGAQVQRINCSALCSHVSCVESYHSAAFDLIWFASFFKNFKMCGDVIMCLF